MLRVLLSLVVALALIACGDDDGPTDAGSDAGSADSGSVDAGGDDAGGDDAGGDDAGGDDAGGEDAGGEDAGGEDAGGEDAGMDAGEPDAGQPDAGRSISTDPCARSFGSCVNDGDCMGSGCGGETCAPESVISTCDCTAPAATCGCVDGSCAWFN